MKKFSLKNFFKRHIALIIFLLLVLIFPVCLSSQAKLNMRIIVTGLAIDKSEGDYEVTAQMVKVSPGTQSQGSNATIDFFSEKAPTISLALSKLKYRAGKVSAFSHTSFVVLGKELAENEGTKCLDVFIRDKVLSNSTLVLFAEDKAGDEIKKTKDIELSVGLGLQKVFMFKQEESDALMVSALRFLNENNSYSKTSCASVLSLNTDDESSGGGSGGSGESGSSGSSSESGGSGGSSSKAQGEAESGGGSSGGGSSSSGSGSGGSGSSKQSSANFFNSNAPIYVFTEGKLATKFEEEEEILGYMIACKGTKRFEIVLEDIEGLEGAKVTVKVKNKGASYKLRFEDEIPCLDIKINLKDAEIVEILTDKPIENIDDPKYDAIVKKLEETIKEHISKAFEKARGAKADVFKAYELAYKFQTKKVEKYYNSPADFTESLKLNVCVDVFKLDY